jgi:nucleotide-binding universal stress UspA family protein
MTFSTIMVCLDLEGSNVACLQIAGDLAKRFNAKLIGIAAASQMYYGKDASDEKLIEWERSDIARRLADAEEHFRNAVKEHAPEIEWRSAIARPIDYVSREARAADLVIIGARREGLMSDLSGSLSLDPGDLVMQIGRPILVVPRQVESLELKLAMVSWKDTREARRAVSDALPLLHKFQEVAVVEVVADESSRTAAHSRVDDVVSWLGRHGVGAFGRVFHCLVREDPMEKLFRYGSDFIVAGAYGHSRMREWVFGGFTHDLLHRSPLCSFLVH